MNPWFEYRSLPGYEAAVGRYALILSLSLLGMIGLYFGALYWITY